MPSDSQRRRSVSGAGRRTFLKQSALLAASGLAVGSKPVNAQVVGFKEQLSTHRNLVLLAPIVLPATSLGQRGLERALVGFNEWVTNFEPVAELDHRYLSTDRIYYGPPDPRPLWLSQLEALDLEAEKRFGTDFAALSTQRQLDMVTAAIERSTRSERDLPRPEAAAHIAVALSAWFFGTSSANDLCYSARIGRHECRGLGGVSDRPRPLPNQPMGSGAGSQR